MRLTPADAPGPSDHQRPHGLRHACTTACLAAHTALPVHPVRLTAWPVVVPLCLCGRRRRCPFDGSASQIQGWPPVFGGRVRRSCCFGGCCGLQALTNRRCPGGCTLGRPLAGALTGVDECCGSAAQRSAQPGDSSWSVQVRGPPQPGHAPRRPGPRSAGRSAGGGVRVGGHGDLGQVAVGGELIFRSQPTSACLRPPRLAHPDSGTPNPTSRATTCPADITRGSGTSDQMSALPGRCHGITWWRDRDRDRAWWGGMC